MHVAGLEGPVFDWVVGIADLRQIPTGELICVDDEIAAAWQILEVRLESRRIHRYEYVGSVAGVMMS